MQSERAEVCKVYDQRMKNSFRDINGLTRIISFAKLAKLHKLSTSFVVHLIQYSRRNGRKLSKFPCSARLFSHQV